MSQATQLGPTLAAMDRMWDAAMDPWLSGSGKLEIVVTYHWLWRMWDEGFRAFVSWEEYADNATYRGVEMRKASIDLDASDVYAAAIRYVP